MGVPTVENLCIEYPIVNNHHKFAAEGLHIIQKPPLIVHNRWIWPVQCLDIACLEIPIAGQFSCVW